MSVDPFYPTPKDTSMHYSDSQGSPFLSPQRGMDEYGLLPFPHKKRRSNSSLSSYSTNYPNSLSPSSPTHLALAIEPNVDPGIDRSAVHGFPIHSNSSTNTESSIFPTMDFDSIAEMANQLMTAPLDSGINTSSSSSPENSNPAAPVHQLGTPSSLQKIDIPGLSTESYSPEQHQQYPLSPKLGAIGEKSGPPPSSSTDITNTYAAPSHSPEDMCDANNGHFSDHQRDFEYSKTKSKPSPSDDRPRSRLTRDQMNALKCVYSLTYFPDKATKERLAHDLDIPVRTIQIWFQNQRQYHRIKLKKRASQHQIHKPTQWQLSPSLGHPQADHQKHLSVSSIHQQALMSAVMAGTSPGNPQQQQFMNSSRRNSAPPNYFQFQDQESIDPNATTGYQPLRRASMMAPSTQSPGPMHGQLMPTVPEHSGLIPPPALQYSDYSQQQQQQQQNYNELPFNMLLNMNPNQAPNEDLKQGHGGSYNDWSQHPFSMGSFNPHANGAYPGSNMSEAYDLPQQQSEPALNSPWINPGSRSQTYSNMLF